MVTTLPAKAGSFWLVPEASARAGASRATLDAPAYVNARRLDPSPLEQALPSLRTTPLLVFLLSRGEVLNAISTAEHLKEPKLASTRDMSYPRAFPVEPPEHTVRVEVLLDSATTRVARQAGSALLGDPTSVGRPLAYGDPHSPPA